MGVTWRRRPVARLNRNHRDVSASSPDEPAYPPRPHESKVNARGRPRVGLLGGSFNPAHEGHRAISLEALRRLGLDQVWWLVSPQNPLKSRDGMADFSTRMESAKTVAAGHPGILVTDLEQKIGTRYTVDTVRRLKRGGTEDFVWLIGSDNLLQLPAWRNWKMLLNLVPIAVFDREPYSYKALAGRVARAFEHRRMAAEHARDLVVAEPPAWVYFRLRRHRVSSTEIRSRQEWSAGSRERAGSSGSTQGGTTEGTSS
ncbi:MAG: nicotinate-nucleotide adenylyltransferase [Geminicoccaceae bacterium]